MQVLKYLTELDVRLDPFFIALWKHVLLIEIIKHRYRVDSQDAAQRFLGALMDRVRRDRSKKAALEYLREFEGKFWQETDQRVREITSKFESQVLSEVGGKLSVPGASTKGRASAANTQQQSERAELTDRFQRIVNETQLPRLNKMIDVLNDDILDTQHYTYIVIDDLDRDWADDKVANDLIRCLFRAVVDLKRVRQLKVLVALRTNILETLDYGPSGGQQEKFRALTMRLRWTVPSLTEVLDTRAAAAAKAHAAAGIAGIGDLLPEPESGRQPLEWILRKTLLRPRDAIAFVNECLDRGAGLDRLSWAVLYDAEQAYSSNRLLALRDEWRPTYPDIDRVLNLFMEAPRRLDKGDLIRLLDRCFELSADKSFRGRGWLEPMEPARTTSPDADWAVRYHGLVSLLYRIGFLGFSLTRRGDDVFSHDDAEALDRPNAIRQATTFVVHPAFKKALDI